MRVWKGMSHLATPRLFFSSNVNSHTTVSITQLRSRAEIWMDMYEEFIGMKAVKEAQNKVLEWEDRLSKAQLERREKQAEIKNLQSRLIEIKFDLDRTSRGEDKFLELLTEEHATIKKERSLLETFESLECSEREAFHQLSTKVRESHQKERERAEKTKWWGVTASLTGAAIGIIGSSIGNELRMRRFKEMLPSSHSDLTQLICAAREEQGVLRTLLQSLASNLNVRVPMEEKKMEDGVGEDKLLTLIREENARLREEISALGRMIAIEKAMQDTQAVVYVGSDMERLLDETEKKLESRMKLQTLLSVVALYSAFGLAIPVLWAVFRGG